MKTYGDMRHFSKGKVCRKNKNDKKQNSSASSSQNTSKISVAKNKFKAGMDYFLNSDFK